MSETDFTQEHIEMMKNVLIEHVPHAKAIGLKVEHAKRGEAWLSVPYAENLIGNPETGVIHGGVITSLLDNACGIAVQLALAER